MNFTPYSIAAMLWPEKLGLERAKDMTRRPTKRWEHADAPLIGQYALPALLSPIAIIEAVYSPKPKLKWQVGRSYPIQPGRGQKQVGRFFLASIGWELDVRGMPPEDVAREGFLSLKDFLEAWARFYGPNFFGPPLGDWVLGMGDVVVDESKLPPAVWEILEKQGR